MCGRLTQLFSKTAITPFFKTSGIHFKSSPSARFNVAPSEYLGVVLYESRSSAQLFYIEMEWGFIFPKHVATGIHTKTFRMINKRVETVIKKPFFKKLLNKQRIAIPISGWYEWGPKISSADTTSIPYYFTRGQPFFLCGLYTHRIEYNPHNGTEHIKNAFSTPLQAVILTTAASGRAQNIHARMPLILPEELLFKWLHPQAISPTFFAALLAAQESLSAQLTIFPVSRHVNTVSHKDARCIEKTHPDTELTLF